MIENLAQQFFTTAEQERITAAVQAVEARTSGEVVPMVVSASHSYPEASLLAAAAFALPAALAAAFTTAQLLWWRGELLWLVLLFFLLFFLVFRPLINRFPSLLRLFLGRARMEAEVERAAFTHFFTEGLQTTREATGVLIFLSVLERRVWILGDRGINERIQPKGWQEFVDRLTAGLRDNRRCDALCAVIAEIGELLADRFPPRPDDCNELNDLVIVAENPDFAGRQLIIR